MAVSETVLYFVVVPALIVLVIGGLAYAFGGGRRGTRYRPGRPYEFAPVWFLSAPELLDEALRRRAVDGGPRPPALPSGDPAGGRAAVPLGSTGGASDRW